MKVSQVSVWNSRVLSRPVVVAVACFVALAFMMGSTTSESLKLISGAYAAEDGGGSSGKGQQQKGKMGGQGQGGSTHVPSGQGGPSDDSDAKGPQYKGGGDHGSTDSGTRPPWAQEGIPHVELGRLNVARAPAHVLDRSLTEAYTTNLDKNGDNVLDADADLAVIDSPIANLALYLEALNGERQVDGTWTLLEAASFLGKASDKYIPVSAETVGAINVILGVADYDYSSFQYDRSAVHPDELATVFNGETYTGDGLDAFAQAADDARAIIVYLHDE